MKVLFAVNNENISEAIIKMYQRDYKEIITYKNVYYFNAILKELQKDKSYDRVIISEDLEPFANNNYDTIDKFIFEKLDKISDEATNGGADIPIILICTDRRTKSEPMLVKMFGIGIYNAILGDDRSVEEVCSLIKSPRNKKEAKDYYKIDTEDVGYQSESEDTVSEVELQNILAHYKRLGKDESRYVESFNNIAAQYNDNQLRIIARILPLNVKAVLEANSPKYQSVMTFRDVQYNNYKKEENKTSGLNIGFLKSNKNKMTKPVVIPSAVDMQKVQKISNKVKPVEEEIIKPKEIITPKQVAEPEIEEIPMPEEEEIPLQEEVIETPKRGRGRPKKQVQPEQIEVPTTPKKGRGRPKKQVDTASIDTVNLFDLSNEDEEVTQQLKTPVKATPKPKKATSLFDLASDDDDDEEEIEEIKPNNFSPRKSPLTFGNKVEENRTNNFLPGLEDEEEAKEENTSTILPGFEDEPVEEIKPSFSNEYNKNKQTQPSFSNTYQNQQNENIMQDRTPTFNNKFNSYDNSLDNLITGDKKIISFVGTSKNGTSFLVNNLAEILSSMGIKTAILDATKNKNSFYIYTKNEEELRKIAYSSFENLRSGRPQGIDVNRYLTVYTSLPGEDAQLQDCNNILTTLIQNYSVILIDCDFETEIGYFEKANEIYLVQSMDILTIQPLTAFLRDLKSKDVLRPEKLRVVINKELNVKDLTEKAIVGGLANYNDPAMSFMTELFNKETIKYYSIPFDIQVYSIYLNGIVECDINITKYPKEFMKSLKNLANVVYPLLNNKYTALNNYGGNNTFSASTNNTLNMMKNRY